MEDVVITQTWVRNSFEIEAVKITRQNIDAVAKWCGGSVLARRVQGEPSRLYVHFGETKYTRVTMTKAFIGDWILMVDDEFKHYRDRSFHMVYQLKAAKREAVLETIRESMGITNGTLDPFAEMSVDVENLTDKIMEFFGEA